MLGALSRQQLTEVSRLVQRPAVGFVGNYVDPFELVLVAATGGQSPSMAPAAPPAATAAPPLAAPAAAAGGVRGYYSERFDAVWGWSAAEAATFVIWWAHRPTACATCGSSDAWYPSAEHEYTCKHCLTGAGSTLVNDVVMEIPGGDANHLDDVASEDDGEGGADGVAGAGGGDGPSGEPFGPALTAQYVLMMLRAMRLAHRHMEHPAKVSVDTELYPVIVRVTLALTTLTQLPDVDEVAAEAYRAAALWIACSLVAPHIVSFPTVQRVTATDVQWHDVTHLSATLGLPVLDFFDEPKRCMENMLVALGSARPPGVMWDPSRSEVARAALAELPAFRREPLSPDHTAAVLLLEYARRQEHLAQQWLDARDTATTKRVTQVQLLPSRAASALLWYIADCLHMPAVALCEMAERSGLYRGPTLLLQALHSTMSCGYYLLPPCRRASPADSPWAAVYRALHSEDRAMLLQALRQRAASAGGSNDRGVRDATATVQQVMRKHGALLHLVHHYALRVDDTSCPHPVQGLYFCANVSRRGALYMSVPRAGEPNRSIRFVGGWNRPTHLNFQDDGAKGGFKHAIVTDLRCHAVEPFAMAVEGSAAKLLIDVAMATQALPVHERWRNAAVRLAACGLMRRRMQAFGARSEIRDRIGLLLEAKTLLAQQVGLFQQARDVDAGAGAVHNFIAATAESTVVLDTAPVDGTAVEDEQAPNPWAATFLALRPEIPASQAALGSAHLLKRFERVVVGGAPDTNITVLGEQLRQCVDDTTSGSSGAATSVASKDAHATEEPSAGARRARDMAVAETITRLPIRLDTVAACRNVMAAVIHHLDA